MPYQWEIPIFHRQMIYNGNLLHQVLVYMQALHGDGIIQWAASAVTAPSAMVMYEQTTLSCGEDPGRSGDFTAPHGSMDWFKGTFTGKPYI